MRVLLAILASLLLAQPAAAATVTRHLVFGDYKTVGDQSVVGFVAEPGEANRLEIRATPEEVRFLDEAPVRAGEGCEQATPHEVVCRPDRSFAPRVVRAHLDDGDDRMTVSGSAVQAYGGAGADRLTGGAQDDGLDGGPGADAIDGAGGDDAVGASHTASREDPDLLDGGPGSDVLSFAGAPLAVQADLAEGSAFVGEKAHIHEDFERLVGSRRSDRLLGGPGSDRIVGESGDDTVHGRGGDDLLTGGGGRDLLVGGAGDDRFERPIEDEDIYADDYEATDTRIRCGSGVDEVEELGDLDTVGASCERVGGFRLLADPRRRATAHLGLPRAGCFAGERCPETFTLFTVRGERASRTRTQLVRRAYTGRGARRPGARRIRVPASARSVIRQERSRRLLLRLTSRRGSVRFLIDLTG